MHTRTFPGVGLDPPGPRHVFPVPSRAGRSGGDVDARAREFLFFHRWRWRGIVWSHLHPFGQVQWLRFLRWRRWWRRRALFTTAPLRQRQYPVHVAYVPEHSEAHLLRRLVIAAATPRSERLTCIHRPWYAGHLRPAALYRGRTPVSVVRVVLRALPAERAVAVARRYVYARVFALVGVRGVCFPLDRLQRGPHRHLVHTARWRRGVVRVMMFTRVCKMFEKQIIINNKRKGGRTTIIISKKDNLDMIVWYVGTILLCT